MRAIVNRGAGRCITCGETFVETRLGGARRDYHGPERRCLPAEKRFREPLQRADRDAIRWVLNATADQFRLSNRTRARRARRRKT